VRKDEPTASDHPPLPVVFADAHVLFVQKPSGLLVHNSAWAGPREVTLTDVVRAQFGPDWSPLSRLDRGTSGLLGFAREKAVLSSWQDALGHDDTDKRYLALVRGHMKAALHVDHAIVDDDDGTVRDARSDITPIAHSSVERCSLVDIRLHTGRTHQARRHCKHVSHPILGDATHGKGPLNRSYRERFGLARLALHARSLDVTHPQTLEHVTVRAPLPLDLLDPVKRLFDAAVWTGLA
jgi:tRNA pseudouridine65 synthase